jgi:phenylpropionate dioxygenase-like ring-hydroxylating dioxygenase large terminal subunit
MHTQTPTRIAGQLHTNDMVSETETTFRLRPQVYTDPLIFQAELRSIFARSWVYIAHESQLPKNGDFFTTAIGDQPVILTRGSDAQIRVFLNVCRHRGNAVCREAQGNTSYFHCPYHGWTYANTGELRGVTQRQGYPASFADELPRLGLLQVPRVAVYRGLVFASLSPDGESLDEYFGPVKKYVDLWADLSPVGTLRVIRPHAYTYDGNWKFQAENGADGYHSVYLHQSAFKTYDRFNPDRSESTDAPRPVLERGSTRGFAEGHGILERPGLRTGHSPEYRSQLVARYGTERAEEILNVRHILLFPNVYLMDANIRVIQPVAVDKTLVQSYFTSLDGVPEDINRERFHDLQRRLGTAGLIGTDDVEIFAGNQTGMRVAGMEWLVLDRGVDREVVYPGGEREGRGSDETPQRAFYRRWVDLMRAAAI